MTEQVISRATRRSIERKVTIRAIKRAAADPYLRREEVEAEIGLSRSTIYRMLDQGEFPRPDRIGRRAVAWRLSVIENWKRERAATA